LISSVVTEKQRGQKRTTGFFNFLLRLQPTDDLDQQWEGRNEKQVSINPTVKNDTFPPSLCNCNISVFSIEIDSQFALALNWKADLQPAQLFKGICALWSAANNLESAKQSTI